MNAAEEPRLRAAAIMPYLLSHADMIVHEERPDHFPNLNQLSKSIMAEVGLAREAFWLVLEGAVRDMDEEQWDLYRTGPVEFIAVTQLIGRARGWHEATIGSPEKRDIASAIEGLISRSHHAEPSYSALSQTVVDATRVSRRGAIEMWIHLVKSHPEASQIPERFAE